MNEEEKHLAYTIKYMEYILEETLKSLGKYKGNIQEALSELDDLDSSLNYTTALSNTRFLEMATKEAETLQHVMEKPYFARIDFQKKGQSVKETYYLGKTSLYEKNTQEPIIVDWRSPIANVYYDGRLGELSYESYEGEIEGYLSLKRQFKIENGKLIDYVDVDMMAADELLLEALSGKADQRLTEIITTIQAEQNRVIRSDLTKPIIVQGAAGSGKTTIALHRLSYFIYRYKERFNPEQLMILAPNQMFIGYIADVLPELGVEKIRQTTFIDFVKQCIGKKIKVRKPEQKLIGLINNKYENENMIKWLAHFKGTLRYKKIIDRFLKCILKQLTPKEDFYLEKFRLISSKRLKYLFLKDYDYLSYYKRLEKIENILRTEIRQKKKLIINQLEKRYDEYLDYALKIKNDAIRKEKVVGAMDAKEERLKNIQHLAKSAVKTYMEKIPKTTLLKYYQQLFEDEEKFKIYAKDLLTDEQISFMLTYQKQLFLKNTVELEDLAALLYLQHKIFGIKKELKVKNVVIDEAQDYSYFQLYALKAALDTDMFTIVGDLAQGIYSYRGIRSWENLQKMIFPEANYVQLQKSYRTTMEIMNMANAILQLMKMKIPTVEPVVRHGRKPTFVQFQNTKDFVTRIELTLKQVHEDQYHSVALIGKSETECKEIFKLLNRNIAHPVQLLKENEEMQPGHLIIVPAYLSKGLESDAVILAALKQSYTLDELDLKLLYVAMTRPMHQLYILSKEKNAFLLDQVDSGYYEVL